MGSKCSRNVRGSSLAFKESASSSFLSSSVSLVFIISLVCAWWVSHFTRKRTGVFRVLGFGFWVATGCRDEQGHFDDGDDVVRRRRF